MLQAYLELHLRKASRREARSIRRQIRALRREGR